MVECFFAAVLHNVWRERCFKIFESKTKTRVIVRSDFFYFFFNVRSEVF